MTKADHAIEQLLNYRFQDQQMLVEALTHSSLSQENAACKDNERLEFLGDRILGLVVADLLYHQYETDDEGGLAKRHAALVSGKMLAEIALEINLGQYIGFSESERQSGGAKNNKLLANAMEAVIGALYLDGGLLPCHTFIEKFWMSKIKDMKNAPTDPKSGLQEWAQARGLPVPQYEMTGKTGPDHAPEFEIEVTIHGHEPMRASGNSRRIAEKQAASMMLRAISS